MSQAKKKYCVNCFFIMDASEVHCRNCSYQQPTEVNPLYLTPPFRLNQEFYIGRVLGHGGFAITYLAYDRNLSMNVAIKEYFPIEFATRAIDGVTVQPYDGNSTELFNLGKDKFINEARLLATLRSKNIITIRQFFIHNNTAYFVMEYIEGDTLTQYVEKQGGKIPFKDARELILPLLDALEEVHTKNAFHRDIKPDNLYITKRGEPILLDFGAARHTVTGRTTNLMAFLTPGFAPAEQYSVNGIQGPWTDIYSLAATFYYALTGTIPPVPYDRMFGENELIPPSQLGSDITPEGEEWLMNALAIRWSQRPDSIRSWRKMIDPHSIQGLDIDPEAKLNAAIDNFLKIAILPKLANKILTRKDEEEIFASAAFMEIPLDRVMGLVEDALTETGSERREMTPEEEEASKQQEELERREVELERKQEELKRFEEMRIKEEEMWLEAEIAEIEEKKKTHENLDRQRLEREEELERREQELIRKIEEMQHFEELRTKEEELWFEAEMARIDEKQKELDKLLADGVEDEELKTQIESLTEEKARLQAEDRKRDLEIKRQAEELYQEKTRLRKALERRAEMLNKREKALLEKEAQLKVREDNITRREKELGITQDDVAGLEAAIRLGSTQANASDSSSQVIQLGASVSPSGHLSSSESTALEEGQVIAMGPPPPKGKGTDLDALSEDELDDIFGGDAPKAPEVPHKTLATGKDSVSLDGHYARIAAEMHRAVSPKPQILPLGHKDLPTTVANSLGMEFVLVHPENTGDPHEPRKAFYLQKTPVTQSQWHEIMENNPSHFDDNPERPVERVSWEDCQLFIHKINMFQEANYRLPKDKEWEYACRAGQKGPYYFGEDANALTEHAWFALNANGNSHPVARKQANPLGLYDMYGNVKEWVQDRNEAVPQPNARTLRGGSWDENAEACTSDSRDGEATSMRLNNIGFRLAIELS